MKLFSFKNKQSIEVYKRLLHSLKPFSWLLVIGLLATMFGSLLDAGLTWLVKPVVEQGFIQKNIEFVRLLPIGVIVIFLLRGGAGFISTYCISRAGRLLVTEYRQRIFTQLLKLPAKFYDKQTSGQLISMIIYNAEQIAEATTVALLTLVQEGFLAIGLLGVMVVLSWKLTLIILIIVPFVAWIVNYTSKRLRRLSNSVQDAMAGVTQVAEQGIEGYRVIRTYGGQLHEDQKFKKISNTNRQREIKVVVTNTFGTMAVQVIIAVPIAAILFLATMPSLGISIGSFAAMIAAIISLRRPLRRLTRVNSMIQKGLAGAESIYNLLDTDIELDTGTKTLERAKGHLSLQNINFSYPGSDERVLKNISFELEPGKMIALVGRSGSGKSTLVSLLSRFYEFNQGKILLDGVDISEIRLDDLRRQFALVSQQVVLFNDTVAHNIAYGKFNDASESEIKEAAKAAYALDFIERLPNQFDTIVGDNGGLLSGGQRQRIAIARAILKNAPILILDEATSSLDTESERYIQAALNNLIKDRATLVIAHRLSTVENADIILVMDKGEIVEQGTHQELLQKNGHYAKLYAMQFNA